MPTRLNSSGEIMLWGPTPLAEQLARLTLPVSWVGGQTRLWAPLGVTGIDHARGFARLAEAFAPWPVEWLTSGGQLVPADADPVAVAQAAVQSATEARATVLILTAQGPWTDLVGRSVIDAKRDGGSYSLQVLESRVGGGDGYFLAETPLDRLEAVMLRLLGPQGCPWDREQTHKTLRPYVIEEAAEVLEAIEQGRPDKIVDELGDLLLQIVFHAALAAESGDFALADVCMAIESKMLHRHPHVFADWQVAGSAEVLRNWDVLKAEETAAAGDLGERGVWRPLRKAAVGVSLAALRTAFAAASGDKAQHGRAHADLLQEVAALAWATAAAVEAGG